MAVALSSDPTIRQQQLKIIEEHRVKFLVVDPEVVMELILNGMHGKFKRLVPKSLPDDLFYETSAQFDWSRKCSLVTLYSAQFIPVPLGHVIPVLTNTWEEIDVPCTTQ